MLLLIVLLISWSIMIIIIIRYGFSFVVLLLLLLLFRWNAPPLVDRLILLLLLLLLLLFLSSSNGAMTGISMVISRVGLWPVLLVVCGRRFWAAGDCCLGEERETMDEHQVIRNESQNHLHRDWKAYEQEMVAVD